MNANADDKDRDEESNDGGRTHRRWFRYHVIVFVLTVIFLAWIKGMSGSGGWFFWTVAIWICVLIIHYFVGKSVQADENWGDRRAWSLRRKSYDFDHISQITQSAVRPDPENDPASPRRE